MKILAVLCIALFGVMGCSVKSITCNEIEKPAVTYVAQNVVMSVCSCSDEAKVEAFIVSKIPSAIQNQICPASGMKQRGAIGSFVCAPLIDTVASMGCSAIPSCTGANPDGAQIQALIAKCQAAI